MTEDFLDGFLEDYDEVTIRVLIAELVRFKEAGDIEGVARIYRELHDAISRPLLTRSTIRQVPP